METCNNGKLKTTIFKSFYTRRDLSSLIIEAEWEEEGEEEEEEEEEEEITTTITEVTIIIEEVDVTINTKANMIIRKIILIEVDSSEIIMIIFR